MTTSTSTLQVSPVALKKHALNCIKSQTPFMVWGNPGIGKSEILRAICEQLGYHFEDIRLSQIDSIDLRGLPTKADNEDGVSVQWAVPDFLQRARRAAKDVAATDTTPFVKGRPTAYFFDEINSGSPATMAAAYQFINDRRVGPHELAPDDIVFAAGNLDTDGGITSTMPTPLCNRFRHYILRVDIHSFLDFAASANFHPWVVGYLSVSGNANKLQQFSPDAIMASDEKSYATPRTWSMVSKALKEANLGNPVEKAAKEDSIFADLEVDYSITMDDLSLLVSSCVGSGIGSEFSGFVREGMDLPKAQDILSGKIQKPTTSIKEAPSKQFFVANDCCYTLKEYKDKVDAVKKEKGDTGEINSKYMKAMENYVKFAKANFAPEMFIYAIVSTMIKRFRLIPEPGVMEKPVFDLIISEFEKAKTSK